MVELVEIDLPEGWINPRIVLGYNNEIRIMVSLNKESIKNFSKADEDLLQQKKMEYLEKAVGYPIVKMDEIIKHDDYEKLWADYVERRKIEDE